MMRKVVYSFTLLFLAYGVAEACFWAAFPVATLFGGLGIFGISCFVGVWALLLKIVFATGLANVPRALMHTYKDGAPSAFRTWRYALGIIVMLIVLVVVLPSLFHLRLLGMSWVTPEQSFLSRLTAIFLAVIALPGLKKDTPTIT